MKLRDYQIKVVDEVLAELKTVRSVLLQAPCGSGKTVMGAEIIRRFLADGKCVLFLAHRRELVLQCADKLDQFGIYYGIIMAGDKPTLLPDVQVASVQTLSRRLENNRIQAPVAHVIIFDECHHLIAKTYISLVDRYPDAKIIGLTATPIRGDGKGLGLPHDF